jgi:membrane-bound lytic murein transglycosylase
MNMKKYVLMLKNAKQNQLKHTCEKISRTNIMAAYTIYNGRVIPVSTKPKFEEYNIKDTEESIAKVSALKKAVYELMIAKRHLMDVEERMKFLKIYDELYSWLNDKRSKTAIETVVLKAVKVLKSYGKTACMP